MKTKKVIRKTQKTHPLIREQNERYMSKNTEKGKTAGDKENQSSGRETKSKIEKDGQQEREQEKGVTFGKGREKDNLTAPSPRVE